MILQTAHLYKNIMLFNLINIKATPLIQNQA